MGFRWRVLALVCVGVIVGVGCSAPTAGPQESASDAGSLPDASASVADATTKEQGGPTDTKPAAVTNPTYFGHVKAILEKNCTVCHKAGGLGPFDLTGFASVLSLKSVVRSAVVERRMPPWQADNDCNSYSNDFSLSEREIDVLARWLAKPKPPEGDKGSYRPPTAPTGMTLPRVDLRLKMKAPYTPPENRIDDYRCFVIDWPHKDVRFVTGFRVKPGNNETVHHLIVYMADAKDAKLYEQLDAKSAGGGYPCFGGPGSDAYPGLLGAWAPGTPATVYPKGTGLRVEPGAKLVLQVHYNITRKPAQPDQSVIELMVEKKVDQEAMIAPFVDPLWMINKQSMHIPKGQSDISHRFAADLTTLTGGGTIRVYGAAMHMHMLGKSGSIEVARKEGQKQCLLNIPRWDFNWQSTFLLKKPLTLREGDKLQMVCRFDNSAANQPILNGQRLKPRDVFWGGSSTDEMCLSFLYITCRNADGEPSFCFDF